MKLINRISYKYRIAKSRYFLKGVDIIIIASSGRTGTQFFEILYKNVDSKNIVIHEPRPDLFNLSLKKIREGYSEKHIQDYIAIHRAKLLQRKYGFLRRIRRAKITFIESNPFIYPLLEEYKSLVKSFKVVYISRDPKTYIISAYNKDPRFDGKNNFYGDTDKRKRLTAEDFNEMEFSSWNNLKRIERIAWYWNKSNAVIHQYVEKNTSDSIWIRFEALFSKDEQQKFNTLKKLLYFSEGDSFSEKKINTLLALFLTKVNESRALSNISNFDDIHVDTKIRIKELVAPMAQKLNYP